VIPVGSAFRRTGPDAGDDQVVRLKPDATEITTIGPEVRLTEA